MAQLKDLIVNGAAKFNGPVRLSQPLIGDVNGNATSANILISSLSANVTGNGKYYYIGSFSCDNNKPASFHSKISVFDKNTGISRAELELHFKHSSDNMWKVKNLFVTSSNRAEKFHLIEISETEIQLWVQIETPDEWQIEVVTIYGDVLTFTQTPNEVYDALPVGIDTLGVYDSPHHTSFGTCDTASDMTSKIITVSDSYWDMTIGSILTVRFENTNTAENPTFNVNNAGAVPVVYDSSNITLENLSYAGYAGRYITYVYTGYSFVFVGWSVDNNTTYDEATTSKAGLLSAEDKAKLDTVSKDADAVSFEKILTEGTQIGTLTINGDKIALYAPTNTDTKYSVMTGATKESAGKAGLVPAPEAGNVDAYLKADGSWTVPPDTKYENASSSKPGLMSATDKAKLDDINIMTGATAGEEGAAGLVPKPEASDVHKFLKGDGTWADPASIIKKSVIPAEATTEIDIPTEVSSSNNMIVYYNGLLMEENVNYYISDSKLIAIDFAFSKDSVVTFVGSNVDGSLNINTPADQVTLANGESKFDGNNSVQSGMEWLASQILVLQSNKETQIILTLKSTDWVDKSQTVEVSDVTDDNTVILCPISQDWETYTDCNVTCISQSDSTLVFECDKNPEVDLHVNVIIL